MRRYMKDGNHLTMFTVVILCLSITLGCGLAVGRPGVSDELWSIEKPGNIVLHGIFPLRERPVSGSPKLRNFNFEGLAWMGAMIRRISEINRAGELPENTTVGYSIRDSSTDPKTGARQTLSILNKIINRRGTGDRGVLHVPAVIGPASDLVRLESEKLFKVFGMPTVAYTTTSSRSNTWAKVIRTVPSDFIHVEALGLLLRDMNVQGVNVVTSRSEPWWSRAKMFLREISKRNIEGNIVAYVHTVDGFGLSYFNVTSQVVVVFAEANMTKILISRERTRGLTWIAVSEFDDPLLSVFDASGNLLNKTVIRNTKRKDLKKYQAYIMKTLGEMSRTSNWLNLTGEKYAEQCGQKLAPKCGDSPSKERCREEFQGEIKSFFGGNTAFRSSLILQGVVDAVDLVVNSVKDALQKCVRRKSIGLNGVVLNACVYNSGATAYWSDSLRNAVLESDGVDTLRLNEHLNLPAKYSVQVLRRAQVSNSPVERAWTFKKVREWNISVDSGDKHDLNATDRSSEISGRKHNSSPPRDEYLSSTSQDMNSSNKGDNCSRCDDVSKEPGCKSDIFTIGWNDAWAGGLYFLEVLMLAAILTSLGYFFKHKNSPIMILCYSWPDNTVLVVLCVFCVLPMMHVGQLSSARCTILWPAVNVMFGFYAGLLLTKTLLVQNLLKCEVATERPGRRMAFGVTIATLQLLFLVTLSLFGFRAVARPSCSSRGRVVLCDIGDNIGVFGSMTFNWLLLFLLCVLAVHETLKQRKNFCRTEYLVVVATVGLMSYTFLISSAFFELQTEHYLVITLTQCLMYLSSPCACLVLVYLPILRLVSTWLRQHLRQQRNLTSIRRAQVISSKRHSARALGDSLFNMNFSPEQILLPAAQQQSGYYFDLRPASAATDLSYPASLVRSVHEPTRFISGYGRSGTISVNECAASFQSAHSTEGLETLSGIHSRHSVYDNLSTAAPEDEANRPSCEALLHEISTYWNRPEVTDSVLINERCLGDIEIAVDETNHWPSLEQLRTSDI